MEDLLDIGRTALQKARDGAKAALGKGVNSVVDNINLTTATSEPSGAPLLDRSSLLRGERAFLPGPQKVGSAVGDFVDSAVQLYKDTPFVDTSGNSPLPDGLKPTSAKEALGNFLGGIKEYNDVQTGKIQSQFDAKRSPGAQAGNASNIGADPTDVYTGVKNPGDASKPPTVGQGLDVQDKAMNARVAQAQKDLANLKRDVGTYDLAQQAGAGSIPKASDNYYNEDDLNANYKRAIGSNSPDTAPTRLPSTDTGTPQGYGGYGNATGAAATGRTTGDGSSDPNSPNFRPVGLGGVPIQSAGEWMQQRANEKAAVRQRRVESNRVDEARRNQEARADEFKKMVDSVPKDISRSRRAKIIAKMYGDYLGKSVQSEGQDKSFAASANKDLTTQRVNAANNRADAAQNEFKRMLAQDDAVAAERAATRKAAYDQTRLGQYQEGIDNTEDWRNIQLQEKNANLQLAHAKNAREAAAATRANVKAASDPNTMMMNMSRLGDYNRFIQEQRMLSQMSPEQLAQYRRDNQQTP